MNSAARVALEGLSVGDAFGERFFGPPELVIPAIQSRTVPDAPWAWTDDTAMALSIVEVLERRGHIDHDDLALAFAERYRADPMRGYGGTAHEILQAIGRGVPWKQAARKAFGGEGSMGNGGAMRAAPIGAFFASKSSGVILDDVVQNARASAEPTHAHADGQAGAIAVAVAAAVAAQVSGPELLALAAAHTPSGLTRQGIEKARALPLDAAVGTAASTLGTGALVISSDTVPFALWCAARHLHDYEAALWTTVAGLGDRDTTCAIVGGIVASAVGLEGIPAGWRSAREPLSGG